MVGLGEMPAFLRTSNNLSESRGTFFLWEHAFLYAELITELKPKDINLYVPQGAAPGAAPPKQRGWFSCKSS